MSDERWNPSLYSNGEGSKIGKTVRDSQDERAAASQMKGLNTAIRKGLRAAKQAGDPVKYARILAMGGGGDVINNAETNAEIRKEQAGIKQDLGQQVAGGTTPPAGQKPAINRGTPADVAAVTPSGSSFMSPDGSYFGTDASLSQEKKSPLSSQPTDPKNPFPRKQGESAFSYQERVAREKGKLEGAYGGDAKKAVSGLREKFSKQDEQRRMNDPFMKPTPIDDKYKLTKEQNADVDAEKFAQAYGSYLNGEGKNATEEQKSAKYNELKGKYSSFMDGESGKAGKAAANKKFEQIKDDISKLPPMDDLESIQFLSKSLGGNAALDRLAALVSKAHGGMGGNVEGTLGSLIPKDSGTSGSELDRQGLRHPGDLFSKNEVITPSLIYGNKPDANKFFSNIESGRRRDEAISSADDIFSGLLAGEKKPVDPSGNPSPSVSRDPGPKKESTSDVSNILDLRQPQNFGMSAFLGLREAGKFLADGGIPKTLEKINDLIVDDPLLSWRKKASTPSTNRGDGKVSKQEGGKQQNSQASNATAAPEIGSYRKSAQLVSNLARPLSDLA